MLLALVMEEKAGFEPAVLYDTLRFKGSSLNHSDTSPNARFLICTRLEYWLRVLVAFRASYQPHNYFEEAPNGVFISLVTGTGIEPMTCGL